MQFKSLDRMISSAPLRPGKGPPAAVVFAEDAVEVRATLRHCLGLGFDPVILIDSFGVSLGPDLDAVLVAPVAFRDYGDISGILNLLIEALEGRWLHYCFNAEFLFFPFCESRRISDVVIFMEEERRTSVQAYVVDLYSDDLGRDPLGVSLDHAHLDRSGYYGLNRRADGQYLDRQFDIFGGLKWRYEEQVPRPLRRIDRIGLFRSARGLQIGPDLLFNDAEYNTISCPWHNNMTVAVASFRTAKALRHNPRSREVIDSFVAPQSEPFRWSSQQLMELGLMEPGQWF